MSGDDSDLQGAWKRGTRADIKRVRPRSSVLSIRVPVGLLEALSKKARSEGKSASSLAKELIEKGLSSDQPTTPSELASVFSRWVDEFEADHVSFKARPK